MIINLTKDNLNLIQNSFLSEETVKNDLYYNPFGRYLIYKENNKVIGYVYYSDIYERGEINQIEVLKDYRNQGIGTKLLIHVIEITKKDLTLEVRKNNYAAITLYKNNGFKEIGIRVKYYKGIDGILMERKYRKTGE